MKKIFDCVFFDGKLFVHASLSLLQFGACFCSSRFSEKNPILGAKVAKTSFLAFSSGFSWYELERSRF